MEHDGSAAFRMIDYHVLHIVVRYSGVLLASLNAIVATPLQKTRKWKLTSTKTKTFFKLEKSLENHTKHKHRWIAPDSKLEWEWVFFCRQPSYYRVVGFLSDTYLLLGTIRYWTLHISTCRSEKGRFQLSSNWYSVVYLRWFIQRRYQARRKYERISPLLKKEDHKVTNIEWQDRWHIASPSFSTVMMIATNCSFTAQHWQKAFRQTATIIYFGTTRKSMYSAS